MIFFRESPSSSTARNDVAAADGTRRSPPSHDTPDSNHPRPSSPTPSTSTLDSTTSFSSATPRKKSEHDFLLFAYLLRFVHREGRVGDFARAGLLFLVEVAMGNSAAYPSQGMQRSATSDTIMPQATSPPAAREATLALAEYLLDSDFAEVLAAGLGALYGLLPSKLVIRAVGTSASTGNASTWDDPMGDDGAGGMVLGGLGPLGEEEDAEEIVRKKEEEEMRLRSLGVGISSTSDFREGIDSWLKLVEFTQDVLRRSPDAVQSNYDNDVDDDARQQQLITSAVTSSILSSLRSLFLQNVLYSSILECSDADGSAVAVISYLDAMLGVVEEGTKLESAILGFLMGEDEARDVSRRQRHPSDLAPSSTPKKIKRRKSSALVLLESASPLGKGAQASSYFNAIGRFSLKDLLASNVHSSSQPTSTAALKLLHTLLTCHDRWSMGLLDVVLDEGATSFPVALREEGAEDPEGEDDSFTYQIEVESDDDSDVFIYPSVEDDVPGTPQTPSKHPLATPSRLPRLLLGTPLPPTPSITAHLDSLDALLFLIASIDPSYRSARAVGAGSEILSTGFANYLQDAEESMAADLGFKRGLAAPPGAAKETIELSPQARRRSTLFGAAPTLSSSDFAHATTMFRHKLVSSATLLSLVLDSLAHFFSHSPELNLALTAVLASLALCPYRSLEGWMLPPVRDGEGIMSLADLVGKDKRRALASDDGDDRSVDCEIDELSRHDALLASSSPCTPLTPSKARSDNSSSLLSILSALSSSVLHYRTTIPHFDLYLSERRQGLMFVENLADALDLAEDGGNAFEDAVKGLEKDSPPSVRTPKSKSAKGPGFGAFLSPRPSSSRSSPNPFSTPPRSNLRANASNESVDLAAGTTKGTGPASPFAVHYRQTGSISVKPVIVSSPAGFVDEDTGDGPPDTPTKRLSPVPPATTASVLSDGSEAGSSRRRREVPSVTLSAILDNTIVLEESIKELSAIVAVRRSLGIDAVRFM